MADDECTVRKKEHQWPQNLKEKTRGQDKVGGTHQLPKTRMEESEERLGTVAKTGPMAVSAKPGTAQQAHKASSVYLSPPELIQVELKSEREELEGERETEVR